MTTLEQLLLLGLGVLLTSWAWLWAERRELRRLLADVQDQRAKLARENTELRTRDWVRWPTPTDPTP